MKRVASDGWFQMFAAIAGLAAVVTLLGRANTRPVATPASPVPAQAAAAPQPNVSIGAQPPAAAAEADKFSLPAQGSSVDLAVPPAAAAPAAAPAAADPPKMTLVGAGVGNAQGIPAAPQAAGGVAGFINGFFGGGGGQLAPLPPANFVKSAKPGVFVVDAAGGGDTVSVRDAVFSAADGDEIQVRPGKYDGNVEVAGKAVKIKGLGASAADVLIQHTGRSAAIAVRGGSLTLEKVRVIYGGSNEFPPREPHGALFVSGGSVIVRKSELGFPGAGEAALIADRGDKPTSIVVEDSELGANRSVILRGALRARFTRTRLYGRQPVAAWLEAVVEFADCKFDADPETTVVAWEGARATAAGAGRPRISTTRGADATMIEGLFGSSSTAGVRRGFSRDIFRRGRAPGQLP